MAIAGEARLLVPAVSDREGAVRPHGHQQARTENPHREQLEREASRRPTSCASSDCAADDRRDALPMQRLGGRNHDRQRDQVEKRHPDERVDPRSG